jgi:hypothetical protein
MRMRVSKVGLFFGGLVSAIVAGYFIGSPDYTIDNVIHAALVSVSNFIFYFGRSRAE